MSIHKNNPNMKSDSYYHPGCYSFLVKGNLCRLLDGRRTPGYIDGINFQEAMFTWRISDFEDKGESWVLPFSKIKRFQFEEGSKTITSEDVEFYQEREREFNVEYVVKADQNEIVKTNILLKQIQSEVISLLGENKKLLKVLKTPVMSEDDYSAISKSYLQFIKDKGYLEQEELTAKTMVLNPNSGEWIKGMLIALAELGLNDCYTSKVRSNSTFEGIGTMEQRKSYLLYRLGFVRAIFTIRGVNEVRLYRGMSTEHHWTNSDKSLLSMSFSFDVASSFASLDTDRFKTGYILKMEVDCSHLFMTCLETKELNERYKESEAIILYNKKMQI